MKIIRLSACNVLKLKAVQITPDGNMVIISGKNGAGKQQPVSEPVLTPEGWKPIGEIKPGDYVTGSDGTATRVKAVHPQEERQVYRLTTSDGGVTRCGPDHLWTVYTWVSPRATRKILGAVWKARTVTTRELLERGLWRKSSPSGSRKWALPNLGPVQYVDAGVNLPVEPYALGAILGDGHIERTGYITVTSADHEILDRLRPRSCWRQKRGSVEVLASAEWSRPLVHLGLAGTLANEKFIPAVYMYASVEERRELLAGLLDTDGCASHNWAQFDTVSPRLAHGVVTLARSLGYIASITLRTPCYTYNGAKKNGQTCYTVRIRRGPCPFALERKSKAWKPSHRGDQDAHRFISSIEQVEDEDSACIEVEAEDGLYVTNDFIVTHNSSVLNAIWLALGGDDASKTIKKPVREGQGEAFVELDLGDLKVRREWSGDKKRLVVENKAGARYPSPQAMLDGLIGQLSFDPVAFATMDDRKQVETLRELTGLDFAELDRDYKQSYEERTGVNRSIKELEAQLKEKEVYVQTPREAVDVEQLRRDISVARTMQDSLAAKESEIVKVEDRLERNRQSISQQEVQIAMLQTSLKQSIEDLANSEVQRDMLQEERYAITVPDIDGLLAQMAEASQTNEQVNQQKNYAQLLERHGSLLVEAECLSQHLQNIQDAKEKAIAGAAMPIEDLSFEGETVLYRGIPFRQCSAAEKLRVSLAMAIALNPQLKVIRIEDASLLDAENMRIIEEMVKEQDYQVWVERVSDGPGLGIYIEDGEVTDGQ